MRSGRSLGCQHQTTYSIRDVRLLAGEILTVVGRLKVEEISAAGVASPATICSANAIIPERRLRGSQQREKHTVGFFIGVCRCERLIRPKLSRFHSVEFNYETRTTREQEGCVRNRTQHTR
jgi:hypothetical protein